MWWCGSIRVYERMSIYVCTVLYSMVITVYAGMVYIVYILCIA